MVRDALYSLSHNKISFQDSFIRFSENLEKEIVFANCFENVIQNIFCDSFDFSLRILKKKLFAAGFNSVQDFALGGSLRWGPK